MHQVAEYGIAAHLKYKAGANNINLEWLDNLTQNSKSIDRFIETTKSDLFIDDVIVFSPAGDSYTLPQGSVVLDFAYAVHSEIGNLATSAFVNKESTSLLRTLKNGDIVKIVTNDKPVLHCSWANVVKTSKAKEGIKAICKQRIREVNKKVAYLIIATMLNLPKDDIVKSVKELNLEKNIHKVTSHLDRLKVVLHKIIKYKNIKEVKFWEILKKGYKKPTLKHMEYFNIYSNKNIDSLEFDYCCHPKLGDEVMAFLERNRVFVHHKLCSKAYEKIEQNSDMVYIEWRDKQSSRYRIIVSLPNKRGVLLELLKELNKLDLNITAIDFNIKDSNNADYCKLEVETTSERSNQIKDIISQKVKIIQFIKLNDAYKS
jgi:(p)ppGpp synthase/HD superfamily hydrolase